MEQATRDKDEKTRVELENETRRVRERTRGFEEEAQRLAGAWPKCTIKLGSIRLESKGQFLFRFGNVLCRVSAQGLPCGWPKQYHEYAYANACNHLELVGRDPSRSRDSFSPLTEHLIARGRQTLSMA